MMDFPTSYEKIVTRIKNIQPQAYAHTRNYVDGAVTYLSPYLSRGVISTRMIWEDLKARQIPWHEMEKLVQELAWRDYFQWVAKTREINDDIKHTQQGIKHYGIPNAILQASTGINGIDSAIQDLYNTGYMHNHCRMYVASLSCNIAGSHWKNPARWMYYHLLDGDWASNACSWQWVAGSNSSKKYYANQQNINKFTHLPQFGTYLDRDMNELAMMAIPEPLQATTIWKPDTQQKEISPLVLQRDKALCIYTHYNLDPLWRKDMEANRVLLLDTQHFEQYPVGDKVIEFIKQLASNIEGIQIFNGSFDELMDLYKGNEVYFKEHPLFDHFKGVKEERSWLTPEISGYYPSFFTYWKKVQKALKSEI